MSISSIYSFTIIFMTFIWRYFDIIQPYYMTNLVGFLQCFSFYYVKNQTGVVGQKFNTTSKLLNMKFAHSLIHALQLTNLITFFNLKKQLVFWKFSLFFHCLLSIPFESLFS